MLPCCRAAVQSCCLAALLPCGAMLCRQHASELQRDHQQSTCKSCTENALFLQYSYVSIYIASATILSLAATSPRVTHPNSEVKLGRVQVVLRWGTTREGWMLQVFFVSSVFVCILLSFPFLFIMFSSCRSRFIPRSMFLILLVVLRSFCCSVSLCVSRSFVLLRCTFRCMCWMQRTICR